MKQEKSRQQMIERHMLAAFERGLDDEECIGYHGTSLESIQYLLKSGHLPGAAEADDKFGYQRGDLFFFPRKGEFTDHPTSDVFMEEREAIEETKVYASILAQAHFIIVSLGLDLDNPENQYIGRVLSLGGPEAEEIIERLAFGSKKREKEIDSIIRESKKRKGVVITIAKSAKSRFPIGAGDDSEQDLYLRCPQGLGYEYISGLEPISQDEWDLFEKIQQNRPK